MLNRPEAHGRRNDDDHTRHPPSLRGSTLVSVPFYISHRPLVASTRPVPLWFTDSPGGRRPGSNANSAVSRWDQDQNWIGSL